MDLYNLNTNKCPIICIHNASRLSKSKYLGVAMEYKTLETLYHMDSSPLRESNAVKLLEEQKKRLFVLSSRNRNSVWRAFYSDATRADNSS